jgi:hypothetical protein
MVGLLLALLVVCEKHLSHLPTISRLLLRSVDPRELDGADEYERHYGKGEAGLAQLREQVAALTLERDELAGRLAEAEMHREPVGSCAA